jgi:hypothetical protein
MKHYEIFERLGLKLLDEFAAIANLQQKSNIELLQLQNFKKETMGVFIFALLILGH